MLGNLDYFQSLNHLQSIYFPKQRNFLGKLSNFDCYLGNYVCKMQNPENFTVDKYIEEERKQRPRLYLLTKQKHRHRCHFLPLTIPQLSNPAQTSPPLSSTFMIPQSTSPAQTSPPLSSTLTIPQSTIPAQTSPLPSSTYLTLQSCTSPEPRSYVHTGTPTRCTNDPVDLQTKYALFSERLIKRGYPKNEIKTVIQEVTAKQRNDTLMVKPKSVLQVASLDIHYSVFKTEITHKEQYLKTRGQIKG
ncbi:unnamed protein product [Mytilus coruscus]|uniref:Uncharacterized protein n=1 Tax=Mytilus coruscus TaxID=42192 RepID=A0A6J8CTD3_MYTCO|nr:unnamed protein product [Mytilus coruscus]